MNVPSEWVRLLDSDPDRDPDYFLLRVNKVLEYSAQYSPRNDWYYFEDHMPAYRRIFFRNVYIFLSYILLHCICYISKEDEYFIK